MVVHAGNGIGGDVMIDVVVSESNWFKKKKKKQQINK
jgi:hypothetical protein